MVCFQRDGNEAVPGCTGLGEAGKDYCYYASPVPNPTPSPVEQPSNELVIMGDNGSPSSAFPLGECQGDCDYDSQCQVRTNASLGQHLTYFVADCFCFLLSQWGLNCYERDGTETVPGCTGGGESGKDYCYVPPSGELVLMGDEDEPAANFPLGECEGDCDNDGDCAVSESKVYIDTGK